MGIRFGYRLTPEELPYVGCNYSTFYRVRYSLALLVGIDLGSMEGFDRGGGTCVSWDVFASEPLVPLLNHSDCDGELSPSDCAKVAPRLRELIPQLDDEYHVEICTGLADMMDECIRTMCRWSSDDHSPRPHRRRARVAGAHDVARQPLRRHGL